MFRVFDRGLWSRKLTEQMFKLTVLSRLGVFHWVRSRYEFYHKRGDAAPTYHFAGSNDPEQFDHRGPPNLHVITTKYMLIYRPEGDGAPVPAKYVEIPIWTAEDLANV